MAKMRPAPTPTLSKPVGLGEISWSKDAAVSVELKDGKLQIVTDDSAGNYQSSSQAITIPAGMVPVVRLQGTVHEGAIVDRHPERVEGSLAGLAQLRSRPPRGLPDLRSG